MKQFSQPAILLLAGRNLGGSFTAEQLLVEAWKLDPDRFSLPGFREFPDMRKAQNLLFGRRSVVRKGLFIRDPDGKLRVAPAASEPPPPLPAGDPPLEKCLERARQSTAYRLFDSGRKDELPFTEALTFWGCWERSQDLGTELAAAIAEFDRLLVDRATAERRALGACHDWLKERFKHHVALCEGRRLSDPVKPSGRPKPKDHPSRLSLNSIKQASGV